MGVAIVNVLPDLDTSVPPVPVNVIVLTVDSAESLSVFVNFKSPSEAPVKP